MRRSEPASADGVGCPPRYTRHVHASRIILAGVLLGAGASAHAQRLNLGGGGSEPRAGDGVATLALAERLEKENAAGAGRAVRSLAAALLRSGENAGPAGAEAVLAGLTLAAKREALDAMLAQATPEVRAGVVGAASGGAPSIVVRDLDLLLRDAIGPLVERGSPSCGWAVVGGDDSAARLGVLTGVIDTIIENRRVDDAAQAPLREMTELFELAPKHPAYLRSAIAWAGLLVDASDAIVEPPAWLDMPARDRVRADFSTGAMLCIDKPEEARVILGRTAAVLRVVRAVDAMPAARQTREVRDAVNRLAGAGEGDPLRDAAAVERIEAVLTRVLDLLSADQRVADPTLFARQVRPMLAPLLGAQRRDADALARLLPSIVGSSDPMTDPAVVAAVSAASRSASDLEMPGRLTDLLTRWPQSVSEPPREPSREPLPLRAMSPLADRIRTLGVALAKPDSAAIDALRDLDGAATGLLAFPGERELRAGTNSTAWQRVTGGELERLVRAIDGARADWLQTESTDQLIAGRASAAARVRLLERAIPLLRDASAFEQLRLNIARSIEPACNAWPGVELTGAVASLLGQDLAPKSAELAAALASGDDVRADSLAEALGRTHAAALVLGRIEGEASGRKLGACDVASELGLGPPAPGAWRIAQRHALAQVCRYGYEAAAAAGERRAKFLEQANRAAAPLVGPGADR